GLRDRALLRLAGEREHIGRGDPRRDHERNQREDQQGQPDEQARRPQLQQLGADEAGHRSPPVSSKNASSRLAPSPRSSYRTMPAAAATAPTRSGGAAARRSPAPQAGAAVPASYRRSRNP